MTSTAEQVTGQPSPTDAVERPPVRWTEELLIWCFSLPRQYSNL